MTNERPLDLRPGRKGISMPDESSTPLPFSFAADALRLPAALSNLLQVAGSVHVTVQGRERRATWRGPSPRRSAPSRPRRSAA